MIQLIDWPATFKEIKSLPHVNDHLKEQARVSLLTEAICQKKKRLDMGYVRIDECLYDGSSWQIFSDNAGLDWAPFLRQFLVRIDFKNKPENENVYFYRLLNIVRRELGPELFDLVINEMVRDSNIILSSNVNEYLSYQKKLSEIEEFVTKK